MDYYPKNNGVFKTLLILVMILVFSATAGAVQNKSDQQKPITLYGPTAPRETLWKVAKKIRPDDSVSVYQVMAAIYISNRDSFPSDNYNDLREGSMLKIPSIKVMGSISKKLAKKKALDDNRAWIKAHRKPKAKPKAKLKSKPKPRIKLLVSGVRTVEGEDEPASTLNTAQDKADSTTSKIDNLKQQDVKTSALEKDSSIKKDMPSGGVDDNPHPQNKPITLVSQDRPKLVPVSSDASSNKEDWQLRYTIGFGIAILLLLILWLYVRKSRSNVDDKINKSREQSQPLIDVVKLLPSPEQFLAAHKNSQQRVIIVNSLKQAYSQSSADDENLQSADQDKISATSEAEDISSKSDEQMTDKEQPIKVSPSAVAEDKNEADMKCDKSSTETVSTNLDGENFQSAAQDKISIPVDYSVKFEVEYILPKFNDKMADKEQSSEVPPSAVAEDNIVAAKVADDKNDAEPEDSSLKSDEQMADKEQPSELSPSAIVEDNAAETKAAEDKNEANAESEDSSLKSDEQMVDKEQSSEVSPSAVVKDNIAAAKVAEDKNEADAESEDTSPKSDEQMVDKEQPIELSPSAIVEDNITEVKVAEDKNEANAESEDTSPKSDEQMADKEQPIEIRPSAVVKDNIVEDKNESDVECDKPSTGMASVNLDKKYQEINTDKDDRLKQLDTTKTKPPKAMNYSDLNEFMRPDGFIDIKRLLSGVDDTPAENERHKKHAVTTTNHNVDGVVADVVAVDVDYNENIVNAKLDLARAYIEIDDKDNAKDLLNDVLSDGNAYQQQEAKRLLGRF